VKVSVPSSLEVGGRWTVKQVCDSHENAVKAVGLLYAKGYGKDKK